MLILVNTDGTISGHEAMAEAVKGVVTRELEHVSARVSRVEVHLSDEDGKKHGRDDVRCMMEARIEGRRPIAVTHHASSLSEAVDGAAERLRRALDTALAKVEHHRHAIDAGRPLP
ncbi:MAG: HPF/RaiA family ribosome-associated protein [Myxococcales bacterium]|nr:HPF/RaiA family ribosome-associated protein [Myxococcales bacterium]